MHGFFISLLLLWSLFLSCQALKMPKNTFQLAPRCQQTRPATALLAAVKTTQGKGEKVTIDSNYNLAIGTAVVTAAFAASNNYAAAVVFALLAALFARQTGRVKFVFDDEAMQIFSQKKDESTGEIVNTSNENVVVGGENRWKYNTWNDWYFIPSPAFPILFYFNENQTNGPETGQVVSNLVSRNIFLYSIHPNSPFHVHLYIICTSSYPHPILVCRIILLPIFF